MHAIEKGKINNDRTFIKPKSFDSPAIVNWRSSREFYGKIKKSSDGTMGIFETQQMSTFFFNSIFLPTPPYRSHCPLPLAIFESTNIYIYIFAINRENPLDRVDASRIAAGGGVGGGFRISARWSMRIGR